MTKNELYKRVYKRWGLSLEIDMIVEECAELIVAISHWKRGRAQEGAIAEEIADVEIMCEQLRYIFGNEEIDAWKKVKLTRLEERIKQIEAANKKKGE